MKTLFNKKISILLIALTGVIITGCNEFLDVTPTGKVIPTTILDFQELLTSTVLDYDSRNTVTMGDDIHIPDYDFAISRTRYDTDRIFYRAYAWDNYIYQNEEVDNDWKYLYSEIFLCNYVLEKIDNASPGTKTESDRARVKGWALFRRAYAYFKLVNLYGKHYNAGSSSSDLGVPLVLIPDPLQEKLPRATVQEIYDRVEMDLNESINLLPDFPEQFPVQNYRPSKTAAYTFMASMFLYKGEWDKSKAAAEIALGLVDGNSQCFLLDLVDLKNNPSNFPTSLSSYTNNELIWLKYSITPFYPKYNVWFLSPELESIIDVADARLSLYCTKRTSTSGYEGYVPFMSGNISYKPYSYQGPKVSSIYLVLAETNARLGNLTEAEDYLKTLREYRIEGYGHTNSADRDQLLKEVINERWIENMYSGLRWFDLKRLNAEGWNITIQHEINTVGGSEVVTLTPDDNRYLIAIPEKIINDFQPDLKQNPR